MRVQGHVEGRHLGEWELVPGSHLVGRDPDVGVRIDHESVSGRHCDLTVFEDGRMLVRDAGSTNGTRVDGARVGVAVLAPGQVLSLGEVELTFDPPGGEDGGAAEAATAEAPAKTDARAAAPAGVRPVGTVHPPAPGPFFSMVPRALLYAAQGGAWIAVLVIVALQHLPLVLPPALHLVAWPVGILAGLYLLQYARDLVEATVAGEDGPPPNPELLMDAEEMLHLVVLYVTLTMVCFGPAMVVSWIPGLPGWLASGVALAGFVYFPMALLAVIVAGSPAVAVHPSFIVRSILRAPVAYLGVVVLLGGIVLLGWGGDWIAGRLPAGGWVQAAVRIVGSGAALFLVLGWLRVLGLFFRYHREVFGWDLAAREPEDPPPGPGFP